MSDEPVPQDGNADADLQNASDIEKADVEVGAKLARHRDDPEVKAVAAAGKVGDQGPLYAFSAALLVAGLTARNRRLTGSAVSMLAALAIADVSKRLIKRLVRRSRPHVLLDEGHYQSDTGGSDEKPEQSFPSGHTAGSVAVACALSRNYPAAGAAAGVAALAIGVSRVAKGAHWPLDVVGGVVIGLAAESIAANALELALPHAAEWIGRRALPILHRES